MCEKYSLLSVIKFKAAAMIYVLKVLLLSVMKFKNEHACMLLQVSFEE
jgi:hypothetical protein